MWVLFHIGIKGSNMIVCVLLVSNCRACCLAPRRDKTRESLTPTIHTQSCLIPIITRCHHFYHSNQYSAHEKQFKVWIESNRSLCCHVTTLSWWQVSQSPPPPVTKMRVPVFAGDWACEIELRQTGVICYPWRQRSWSCGVFTSWILDARCPFQWKWQVLHNYDISVLQQVGMFFDGIACLMKVWPLFNREFPRESCPDDVTLRSCTRDFQMWRRRCKQIDPHWFQGRQMRFWWMLSTMSWK